MKAVHAIAAVVCLASGVVWFLCGIWPLSLVCIGLAIYAWASRNPSPYGG